MYRDFRKEMEQIRLTEEKKEQMWQSLCRETGLDPAVKMVSVHDGQIQGQKKAVRLIGALFRGSSTEAVEQLGDVYKDTEESWVYEGIRYTLNGYWYDRENGYAMAEIGIETVDGSPFLDWGEAYEMLEESDWQESEFFEAYPDADAWREACAGGEESYETYGRMADEAGVFLQTRFSDAWYRSGAVSVVYGSDHTADCFLADSFVFGQDGQMLENFQLELVTGKGQVVGTYQMEDTGALPIAVVRCPELLGGDRMEFSGAGFLLRLEEARRIGFELETLQVVLRDGTEYCYDVHADDRQEEADQTGEADWEKSGELEYFREGEKNFTSLGYMESLTVGLYCYSGTLEDYIDVHEIASVTLNGVSCTIEVVQPEG